MFLISAVCITVFGYALYEARFLISGPELTILSPKNNSSVSEPLLPIKGVVKNISSLEVDGRALLIRQDGSFDDKLLLLNGYNTIQVKVKNKFGQENSKILEITLAPPA